MKPLKSLVALLALIGSSLVPTSALASTHIVSNFAELQSAVGSAVDGDLIEFSANVIATSRLSTNKDITIDGKGFLWSVTTPGLDEAGIPTVGASNHGLITFQNGSNSVLRNLTMWGGSNTATAQGTVRVDSGASLRILDSAIERSYTDTSSRRGGGGLINYGTTVLDGVKVRRNGAGYGGGFLNYSNLIIVNSTFSDNRSTSTSGGGGAGENGSGGKLWIVNSTFANNLSTEIGSAINNYRGQFYIASSTFVGNLGTSSTYACGAVGVNGGSGKIVSSLFAYNYEVVSGNYALVDLGNTSTSWSGCKSANIEVDYSMIHSANALNATAGWLAAKGAANVSYSATIDGQSGETLFSGGVTIRPTGGDGEQISVPSTTIFRPNLLLESEMPIAKLRVNNVTPDISSAAPIYFEENGGSSVLAFWDDSAGSWSVMSGTLPGTVTAASDSNLTVDQVGTPLRSPAALGSTELTSEATFSVVAIKQTGGNVTGASVYGDAFPANTRVEVAAVPDSGFAFSKWQIELESGSALSSLMAQPWGTGLRFMNTTIEATTNPITFAVTTNTTIKPIFVAAAAGTHSVVYSSNGATGGSAPSASVESAGATHIAQGNSGSLTRIGFAFAGWNTAANGSGTQYTAGDSITVNSNVSLFAQWTPVPVVTISFDGNGSESGSAPSSSIVNLGSTFAIPANTGNLTRAGFTFGGWNTSANGDGTNYSPGSSLTGATTLVLYAKWDAVLAVTPPITADPVAPPRYLGPVVQGVEPAEIFADERVELTIFGERLDSIADISINGVKVEQIEFFEGYIKATFSALDEGTHSMEIIYGQGARVTQLNAVTVLPAKPVVPATQTRVAKVNAGSFKGIIAIYARALEGRRLSVNLNGSWTVVEQIPSVPLYRLILPASEPENRIAIYIDRQLRSELTILRRG